MHARLIIIRTVRGRMPINKKSVIAINPKARARVSHIELNMSSLLARMDQASAPATLTILFIPFGAC